MQGVEAGIAILEIVIPLFVRNQTADAEIAAFLADLGSILANPSIPVTFPPITFGNGLITIGYGPKS
jgi:hypothetical protein